MNKVLVIGSINMDLVVHAARFPMPGETVSGKSFTTFPGGKGANQAVAACRLGARVAMIGCVGEDAFGTELLQGLRDEGIDTRYVRSAPATPTGVASIIVNDSENAIVVVPGANHALTPGYLRGCEAAFAVADIVLCQLEIPLPVVEAAAAIAFRHRKPFLLNPAPAMPLPENLLAHTTLLTPNEHELSIVLAANAQNWQNVLINFRARILMTHGAEGAWFADAAGKLRHQPGFAVQAVDATGAGDTFNGALAAFWGRDFGELVRLACAAGALSVTREGARSGMPTKAQLDSFLSG